MGFADPELYLPKEILQRSRRSGNEHAWRIVDIPTVIEAARAAGLVNVGGQLQFLIPEELGSGTCECYWVEVDTYKSVSEELAWELRVSKTAEVALADFERLQTKYDFLKLGRDWVSRLLEERGLPNAEIEEMMWFVWYVEAPAPARATGKPETK